MQQKFQTNEHRFSIIQQTANFIQNYFRFTKTTKLFSKQVRYRVECFFNAKGILKEKIAKVVINYLTLVKIFNPLFMFIFRMIKYIIFLNCIFNQLKNSRLKQLKNKISQKIKKNMQIENNTFVSKNKKQRYKTNQINELFTQITANPFCQPQQQDQQQQQLQLQHEANMQMHVPEWHDDTQYTTHNCKILIHKQNTKF
eukprot:TRINITY_DN6974_c1_g1_i1.p2 TRINITY_DN6974_c1_g1~~TRINITY_DN6974_c1_g1_i1.p2  ORF type:complete len:199 (-),score=-3.73 TRINITY_DN6974_c1_g1_i1:212-808(-)